MNPQPSAEALKLAVNLRSHCGYCQCYCQSALQVGDLPCSDCLKDASTIDRELQLPQRNAALRLAQGVCDAEAKWKPPLIDYDFCLGSEINELRAALADIKPT